MWPELSVGAPSVRLVFPAEARQVRHAMLRLFGMLPPGSLADATRGDAEIVIAEVLNNVVEHAYADGPGEIALAIRADAGGLVCMVADHGAPLPDHRLPRPGLPQASGCDLPEGGFGWFLILSLAQDVHYVRMPGTNLLGFRIPANGCPDSAGIVADPETLP